MKIAAIIFAGILMCGFFALIIYFLVDIIRTIKNKKNPNKKKKTKEKDIDFE